MTVKVAYKLRILSVPMILLASCNPSASGPTTSILRNKKEAAAFCLSEVDSKNVENDVRVDLAKRDFRFYTNVADEGVRVAVTGIDQCKYKNDLYPIGYLKNYKSDKVLTDDLQRLADSPECTAEVYKYHSSYNTILYNISSYSRNKYCL